jgi:methyl-accepting chemotaxis protein
LEIAMKSKASPAARRHTAANPASKRNGNGNGHSNGHGHADGDGAQTPGTTKAATRAARRIESLDGQPTIAEILGAQRREHLDKTKLLQTLTAFKKGDFSVRMPGDLEGLDGKIADALNDVIEQNQRMGEELARLSRVVGKEGKMTQRISIGEVTGGWKDAASNVNALISDLAHPVSETARVIGAVAKGDLSQTMALEIEGRPLAGEFLRTARTVNTMVDQLGSFASEVTRVAREVGTEGKLGGQAKV